MTRVPFGALSGFSIKADAREIAAWYDGVRWHSLMRAEDRGRIVTEARHAFYWKLVKKRGLTPERVSQLLRRRVSADTVRVGADLHVKRISDFATTGGQILADATS